LRSRARAARSFISAESAESDFMVASFSTGVKSPPSMATATATSEGLSLSIRSPAQTALASGTCCSASAQALMMKSLTDSFTPRAFELAVELAAERQQRVEPDVAAQVEMRDGLLGLGQARGDGLAHPVELDLLVVAAAYIFMTCSRRGPAGIAADGRRGVWPRPGAGAARGRWRPPHRPSRCGHAGRSP
jgi:hypothetical protein